MNFKTYGRWNTIAGWIVFAIAAFTYLNTMELTVSLWDTGEFISCANELQVPHPPGAPMYVLIYKMFTLFAGGNEKLVPIMTNAASALASAFTILFLFWTISELALRLIVKDENNISKGDSYAVLGAAVVGALAYTFSDTFWFSAVEAEVYALSSMFTALVFWLALKWERRAHERGHLRWMILIFYLTGVVIGIHLLGLLVLPVIVLMYYFRKYPKVTRRGTLIAAVIGFAVLGIVQYGIIQALPIIASKFDLMFVNSLGLPFWSGVIFFFAALFAVCGYFIWRTHRKGLVMWNTSLICFVMVTLGYMSYGAAIIRSNANPSIDMNNPEDIFSLISYVSREQYGDNYLVTGPYYTAYTQGAIRYVPGGTDWRKFGDEYVDGGVKIKTEFPDDRFTTFFPRMFNGTQDNYIQGYRYWGNVKGEETRLSFTDNNLRFFFNYQINYMYWRYFAWNFIGRQNDIQGMFNEFNNGNWITGIGPIDQALGNGPQDDLPNYLAENRARNKLYALPFILGLIGMYYQYKRRRREFGTVLLFFFMTGLAIALYLNMPSPQPRERDYAFVGSFYVFAIWIGLGVLYFYDLLKKRMAAPNSAGIATLVCLAAVPALMAATEWDDHDRSHRTAPLDYGVNYLESCAPNSVLFTNGDNDTYPLWYAQEVEGIRDDIRVINLSLFSTDWYVNQMRKPINDAPALKFSLTEEQMLGWDLGYHDPERAKQLGITDAYYPLTDVIKYISNRNNFLQGNIQTIPFVPTRKFYLPVDREHVKKLGFIKGADTSMIVDTLKFSLGGKTNFMKSEIMLLDFIATNNWEVPIYFSATSGPDDYLNLTDYLRQEGLVYRLVPAKRTGVQNMPIEVDTDIMYKNVMTKFRWGQLDKNTTLVDFQLARSCHSLRNIIFARLAYELMNKGEKDKAIQVADKCLEVVPERNVPYDFYMATFVDVYLRCGANDKGKKLAERLSDVFIKDLTYYAEVYRKDKQAWVAVDQQTYNTLQELQRLEVLAEEYKFTDLANKLKPQVARFQDPMVFPPQPKR